MTRGVMDVEGARVTVSLGPSGKGAHDYYARVEVDGRHHTLAGSAPTYREAWDALLVAVERALK